LLIKATSSSIFILIQRNWCQPPVYLRVEIDAQGMQEDKSVKDPRFDFGKDWNVGARPN